MVVDDIREVENEAVITLKLPREELWANKFELGSRVQLVYGGGVKQLLMEAARRLHTSDNGWLWSMAYDLEDRVKQLEQEGVKL